MRVVKRASLWDLLWLPERAETGCLSFSNDAQPSTVHTADLGSVSQHVPASACWGSLRSQRGSGGMVGEEEGTRQGLSANGLLTESLRALGAAATPPQHTLHLLLSLPTLLSDTTKVGTTSLGPLHDSQMAPPAAQSQNPTHLHPKGPV